MKVHRCPWDLIKSFVNRRLRVYVFVCVKRNIYRRGSVCGDVGVVLREKYYILHVTSCFM